MTTLFTDLSSFGFGGVWRTEHLHGRFTEKQKLLSINTKELLVIYYVLSMLGHRLHGEHMLLMCDNMTALFYIKNFGSRDVLRDVLTKKVYHLAKVYCFTLEIKYVPSKSNVLDKSSRKFQGKTVHTKWTLCKSEFDTVLKLSKVPPKVDMFTSLYNTQLSHFISWAPCEKAMAVDAFTLEWTNIHGYLFAPISLVGNVLKKYVDDRVKFMCGVFPYWPKKM